MIHVKFTMSHDTNIVLLIIFKSMNIVGGKKLLVTTPIFYANGKPHIGHLYTVILADYLKRWHELRGEKVILSTGTDEHGAKMMKTAQAAGKGIDAKKLSDTNSAFFRQMVDKAYVSYDRFIRTTEGKSRV